MTELLPCVGRWDLFDSVHLDDHRQAAALCATCPAIDWCHTQLNQTRAAARARPGPTGTWAGRLYGAAKRGQRTRPVPTPKADTRPTHCPGCDRPFRRGTAPPEEGVRHAARGLCSACYSRKRYAQDTAYVERIRETRRLRAERSQITITTVPLTG